MNKTKTSKRGTKDMVSVGIDLGEATSHATIFANETHLSGNLGNR
jgi:hypothetical protein